MATEWETVGGEIVEDLTATRMRQPARRDAQLARWRTSAAPRPRKFFARLFGVLAAVGLFISVALIAPVTTMSELAADGLPLCCHCSHSFARLRFARRAGRGFQVLTEVVTGKRERSMNARMKVFGSSWARERRRDASAL